MNSFAEGALLAIAWSGAGYLLLRHMARLGVADSVRAGMSVATGVLGTFFGITWTLYTLQAAELSGSELIEQSFGGMSTAFVTSIFGLAYSIKLKFYAARAEVAEAQRPDPYLETLERIARATERLPSHDIAQQNHDNTIETLEALTEELSGFADSVSRSVTDSIRDAAEANSDVFRAVLAEHLGQEFRDLRDSIHLLNEWQKGLGTQLTEQQAILSAATDTLRAANLSLATQQQRLENATDALVVMVNETRNAVERARELGAENDRLERLVRQMSTAIAGLEAGSDAWNASVRAARDAEAAIELLRKEAHTHAETNQESVRRLGEMTEQVFEQTGRSIADAFAGTNERFTRALDHAAASLENKQQIWDETIGAIGAASEDMVARFEAASDVALGRVSASIVDAVDAANERLADIVESVATGVRRSEAAWTDAEKAAKATTEAAAQLQSQIRRLTEEGDEIAAAFEQAGKDAMQRVSAAIVKGNAQFDNAVKARVEKLDAELADSLGSAMVLFAGHVATISEKFARDYTPLAENLSTVMTALANLEKSVAEAEKEWRAARRAPPTATGAPRSATAEAGGDDLELALRNVLNSKTDGDRR